MFIKCTHVRDKVWQMHTHIIYIKYLFSNVLWYILFVKQFKYSLSTLHFHLYINPMKLESSDLLCCLKLQPIISEIGTCTPKLQSLKTWQGDSKTLFYACVYMHLILSSFCAGYTDILWFLCYMTHIWIIWMMNNSALY